MSTSLESLFSDAPVKTAQLAVTDDKPEANETPAETPAEVEPSEPAEPSPAKEPPEADKPTENAQPREANGKFAKTVPQEALHAAREKQRESDARAAAAEARAAAAEARLAEGEKKPKTSVHEDEDKAFQERLSEATRPLAQRLFNMSVAAAKRVSGREDYQEVYAFMEAEVRSHPELMRDIDAADDPGEYIYQLGKTRKELAEVGGDITKLREATTQKFHGELNKRDERIKTLEQEIASLKAGQEKREKIPQSTNAESSGAVKDDSFTGPTPLKKLFS